MLGSANWITGAGGAKELLIGCYDTKLYKLDLATGKELWSYATENYVNGTPATDGERVVFGGCDAYLHVVSTETGEALDKVMLGEGCHVAVSPGRQRRRLGAVNVLLSYTETPLKLTLKNSA